MNDVVDLAHALEVYRVGALVLGAERVSAWRPRCERLRAVVDGVGILHSLTGGELIDVGLLADVLRAEDPSVDWAPLLHYLMARWDEVQDAIAARGPLLLACAEVLQLRDCLHDRLDDLLVARAGADTALERLREALDRFDAVAAGEVAA